jgi:hypothetical protein
VVGGNKLDANMEEDPEILGVNGYICLTCGGFHKYKSNVCSGCNNITRKRCDIPCVDCENGSKHMKGRI